MSFINGLLVGLGNGLKSGTQTYLAERDKRRQEALASDEFVARRMEAVDRMMREHDEFEERKRSNRKQEELEHERNVSGSLDRMLARENARAAQDETTRRAIETALIRAQSSREHEAAVSERAKHPRPRQPSASNPDGLTQTQRDGLLLINREWQPSERAEMHEFEAAWRKARAAFPDAHPGDVAMAAKRYLDRIKHERQNRY